MLVGAGLLGGGGGTKCVFDASQFCNFPLGKLDKRSQNADVSKKIIMIMRKS